ncbi:heterokaryon incompatibility protein-domain-containing protein [Clohesyomyces aquaticus]|uniref:Heterokaryon incompatibility protein-domain-containing protein n=1 Tax=Clohesyomyces aquaticus TaxID=1231657 RepID=A0A1Y1ZM28_9PLEO|nr:heterokaryon incompatibility protein-domain-containing protein [Clohesyomyces aquaticus]
MEQQGSNDADLAGKEFCKEQVGPLSAVELDTAPTPSKMEGVENANSGENSSDERINRFDRVCRPSSPSPLPSLASTTSSMREHSPPSAFYISEEDESQSQSTAVRDWWQPRYSYATIRETEFRLLRIAPGTADEPIHGALKILSITRIQNSKLKFQALSYAWGEGKPIQEILLQNIPITHDENEALQERPRPFAIRTTLHQALGRIRQPDKHVWIWVDAICINQKDDSEKSHQLPKMIYIYSNAWNVTIWLGENEDGDNDSTLAMDFLPKILNLASLDIITAKDGIDDIDLTSWKAFASLIGRPWFCRRWVIQEVAYAKRLSIRCGERVVSWVDFADAVELFLDKLDQVRELYSESRLSRTDPDALQHVESSGARALVKMSRNVFRKTSKGDVVARLWDLETLVLNSVSFGAKDSRDVVYGLLSLASDAPIEGYPEYEPGTLPTVFIPDYSKKARDVLIDFVEYSIAKTSSLDIICRHWALRESKLDTWEGPSWIGLVSNSTYGGPMLGTGRINGESLVGKPGERIYNASRGVKICAKLDEHPSPSRIQSSNKRAISEADLAPDGTACPPAKRTVLSFNGDEIYLPERRQYFQAPQTIQVKMPPRFNGILQAKGIMIGTIRSISSRVVEGTIPEDALKILGWDGSLDKGIDDSIWRTLVADRGLDGNIAPSWYRRACAVALTKASPEGDLNTAKLMQSKTQPGCVTEYLKRVQTVVWGRKFFSIDEAGKHKSLMGLGSRFVRGGDIVCILFGCSVPVILREEKLFIGKFARKGIRTITTRGMESKITLVGECYIHGMMEGEAFADLQVCAQSSASHDNLVLQLSTHPEAQSTVSTG